MSTKTPREELGSIAGSLRRTLGRERAGGGGEMLASSARSASTKLRGAKTAAASATASVPRAETGPASRAVSESAPRAQAKPAPAPEPVVNLFGEPEPVAAAATSTLDFDLPPAHGPLNPIGIEERAAIESDSLAVLRTIAGEVCECRLCGLCDTRSRAVPGTGTARSGIVFVGEAPGAEEDRQGEPFVGRAGELLTKIIKAMDDARLIPDVPLTRETVYICNVLKCRPPENRNPLPHEVELCAPYLKRQLEVLKPRMICCLGKFAAELLVGVKGTIAGLRGRTYRYQGARLIVTYHPAACLRNPNLKRPVWEDMQLLAREYMSD
jgi:DNA polymerase